MSRVQPLASVALGLLACVAAGCLEVEEHLTIRRNGSGTVTMTMTCDLGPDEIEELERHHAANDKRPLFPPLSRQQAEKLFPAQGFALEVKEESGRRGTTVTVEAAFEDINALIHSPYGEAHLLRLWRDGGRLRFAARSGLLRAVLVANGRRAKSAARRGGRSYEAWKRRGEIRSAFSLTLPAAAESQGGEAKGQSVTWRLDCKGAEDEGALIGRFMEPLRASCPAAGLGFEPMSPPRLGLLPFDEVEAGPAKGMPPPPDPARVAAAARVTPVMVKTAQSFYLPGHEAEAKQRRRHAPRLHEHAADLLGIVELPWSLKPDVWGGGRVEGAVDDRGTDLLLPADAGGLGTTWSSWDSSVVRETTRWTARRARGAVWLRFAPPGPQARRIQRLEGSVELEYFDDFRVVKLPRAIPADWVQGRVRDGREVRGVPGLPLIEAPQLAALGITLRVHTVEERSRPFARGQRDTSFWFSIQGQRARVVALQVFDAEGKAHLHMHWGRHAAAPDMRHFAVRGTPAPPFSLALLVSGRSVKARVPVHLEDLPLADKAEEKQ